MWIIFPMFAAMSVQGIHRSATVAMARRRAGSGLLGAVLMLAGCWMAGWANAQVATPEHLGRLKTQADFDLLKGKPLSEKYGQVESIKIVLDLRSDRLYFVSSKHFEWHYDFCAARLGFWQSNYLYNQANYSAGPDRRYALANINHLVSTDRWTLEFSSADQIPVEMATMLYERVADSTFVGREMAIFLNTPRLQAAFTGPRAPKGIATITPDEVYQGLQYQALNCKKSFGYLRRVRVDSLETAPPGPRDIVVLDGPALDIPAVAGLLSPEFQTPLSHLNILSKNRGTPFLAQKGIWDDSLVLAIENQLVMMEVFPDSFKLVRATQAEAEAFWNAHQPRSLQKLKLDTKTRALQEMDDLGLQSVRLVGGKASNFAILRRLALASKGKWRVPEGAFAVPFHWYCAHMEASGANKMVNALLADEALQADSRRLRVALGEIQARIAAHPVDTALLRMIETHVRAHSPTLRMRFRSSTNAEDIEGFNGAGLYDSQTGIVGDSVRTVAKALKAVWGSLWNFRAFQERAFFRIDHRTCAMGILAHRSFPDEQANGVAITKNLYRADYYGFTINVQEGEVSVVSPPPGTTCDQIICYSDSDVDFYKKRRIVEYVTSSSLTGGRPVLTEDEIILLTEQLAVVKRWYFDRRANSLFVDTMNWNAVYNAYGLDVEFKFDGPERVLYIKQVRPFKD